MVKYKYIGDNMKKITDINIKNRKVIIRCDFNVPIVNGRIKDDTRIKKSIPTINYCLKNNCSIILLSHLGRVKTQKDKEDKSLKVVAKRLEKLLNRKIIFINETRGEKLTSAAEKLMPGEIILVENTRFEDIDNKESSNDKDLGKYWASLGDVFVNDAFGTIHRKHASNVGIASNIESCIGLLVEKELESLNELKNPKKPFVIILGGAKVKDKIGVIKKLLKKADYILIGGGMAFTFLSSEGFNVGNSLIDYDSIDFCREILEKYPNKILLPIDVNTTYEFNNEADNIIKDIIDIEDDDIALDIGPKTVKLYKKYLKNTKTVLWNGPLGVYEFSKYKKSTNSILKYLVKENIKTILGGGDIVAAATACGVSEKIYHVSTGGGATLEYLEGKKLPGLKVIENQK